MSSVGRRIFAACCGAVWLLAAPLAAPQGAEKTQLDPAEARRNEQLRRQTVEAARGGEYRIGSEDLLEINVFEAPELNRQVRVSASGEISLPLLGAVRAAGLTPRELETVLEELLRRKYLKEPHVGVFVREMQSHAVAVVGAVEKPGVYQIRGRKPLLEVLAMAEGLAADAGDTIRITRAAAPNFPPPREGSAESAESAAPANAETLEISLKQLLESGDAALNVEVRPGDVVKVSRAGVIYVVGDVRKPGGFTLRTNENITVLQALALAEGVHKTAAKNRARIIRTDPLTGQRSEMALDLGKVLAGKAPDPRLLPNDILFVPDSAARNALYRGAETALSILSGVIIFRR
jgi:polysaccharide export outer membrane protein